MYRTIDPSKVVVTLEQLERRIRERFPGAGLPKVCAELTEVARESQARADQLARPNLGLRLGSSLIILLGLSLIGYVAINIPKRSDGESIFSMLQGIDAFFNIIVLMGAAVIFLVTLEGRWKRQQALANLHELRSIIHVIDMHQLTKDPSSGAVTGPATQSSPMRTMSPFELMRYLDYCSEMLSLTAKVAALYAQSSRDPLVVEASSDLQQITSNLSNKIWQKINLVQAGTATAQQALPPSRPPVDQVRRVAEE